MIVCASVYPVLRQEIRAKYEKQLTSRRILYTKLRKTVTGAGR